MGWDPQLENLSCNIRLHTDNETENKTHAEMCIFSYYYVTLRAELRARITLALMNESGQLFAEVTLSPKGERSRYPVKRGVGNHSRLRCSAPAKN